MHKLIFKIKIQNRKQNKTSGILKAIITLLWQPPTSPRRPQTCTVPEVTPPPQQPWGVNNCRCDDDCLYFHLWSEDKLWQEINKPQLAVEEGSLWLHLQSGLLTSVSAWRVLKVQTVAHPPSLFNHLSIKTTNARLVHSIMTNQTEKKWCFESLATFPS